MIGWIVTVILLVALVAVLVSKPSKRFGLKEAKAALQYVCGESSPQVAKTVLAVVVGVLGYENAVASDVSEETLRLANEMDDIGSVIEENEQIIAQLRAEIERLRSENSDDSALIGQLREIAEIFRG